MALQELWPRAVASSGDVLTVLQPGPEQKQTQRCMQTPRYIVRFLICHKGVVQYMDPCVLGGEGRVAPYWARHLLCALLATINAGLCCASVLTAAQPGCSLYCCHLFRGVYSDQAVPCMGWL